MNYSCLECCKLCIPTLWISKQKSVQNLWPCFLYLQIHNIHKASAWQTYSTKYIYQYCMQGLVRFNVDLSELISIRHQYMQAVYYYTVEDACSMEQKQHVQYRYDGTYGAWIMQHCTVYVSINMLHKVCGDKQYGVCALCTHAVQIMLQCRPSSQQKYKQICDRPMDLCGTEIKYDTGQSKIIISTLTVTLVVPLYFTPELLGLIRQDKTTS